MKESLVNVKEVKNEYSHDVADVDDHIHATFADIRVSDVELVLLLHDYIACGIASLDLFAVVLLFLGFLTQDRCIVLLVGFRGVHRIGDVLLQGQLEIVFLGSLPLNGLDGLFQQTTNDAAPLPTQQQDDYDNEANLLLGLEWPLVELV